MFNIGDLIIYGGEGVCRVEEIGTPNIQSMSSDCVYYTLKPFYREGKTYIPIDTNVFMRPIISAKEAKDLIDQIPEVQPNICKDTNLRVLNDHYKEFLQTHDCIDLMQLIITVYTKGKNAAENNKKLNQIDERYMKRAEDLLHGELAAALGTTREEIKEDIFKRIALDSSDISKAV